MAIALLSLTSSVIAAGTRCTNKVTKFQTADHYPRTIDLLPSLDGRPTRLDWGWFPYCKISFVAVTESSSPGCDDGPIGCVKLSLGDDYTHKQRVPPYSLYGDDHGEINFDIPGAAYTQGVSDSRCTRGQGTCLELELEMFD